MHRAGGQDCPYPMAPLTIETWRIPCTDTLMAGGVRRWRFPGVGLREPENMTSPCSCSNSALRFSSLLPSSPLPLYPPRLHRLPAMLDAETLLARIDTTLDVRWLEARWAGAPAPAPTFHCASCDRSYPTLSSLRTHLRSLAHLCASLACPFCARGFATGACIVQHLELGCAGARYVTPRNMGRCLSAAEPAGYVANLLAALQPAILRIRYAARQDMFRCKTCGLEVTAAEIVRRHILIARESETVSGEGRRRKERGETGADDEQTRDRSTGAPIRVTATPSSAPSPPPSGTSRAAAAGSRQPSRCCRAFRTCWGSSTILPSSPLRIPLPCMGDHQDKRRPRPGRARVALVSDMPLPAPDSAGFAQPKLRPPASARADETDQAGGVDPDTLISGWAGEPSLWC